MTEKGKKEIKDLQQHEIKTDLSKYVCTTAVRGGIKVT
jgi:hypothetical protein